MAFEVTYVFDNSDYFPALSVKGKKIGNRFRYSVALRAFIDCQSREIARIDNYHGKGNHIHIFTKNGTESEEKLERGGVRFAVKYFRDRWMALVEGFKGGK